MDRSPGNREQTESFRLSETGQGALECGAILIEPRTENMGLSVNRRSEGVLVRNALWKRSTNRHGARGARATGTRQLRIDRQPAEPNAARVVDGRQKRPRGHMSPQHLSVCRREPLAAYVADGDEAGEATCRLGQFLHSEDEAVKLMGARYQAWCPELCPRHGPAISIVPVREKEEMNPATCIIRGCHVTVCIQGPGPALFGEVQSLRGPCS